MAVAETDAAWSVRYAAAQALARIGDPRFQSIAPVMITIPAGEFTMGSEAGQEREKPSHRVDLSVYRIGKYPVTNIEYKRV